MLTKQYYNKLAKNGDTVVAISNPFGFGDWKVDCEYTVAKAKEDYFVVTCDSLPKYRNEILTLCTHECGRF